MPRFTARFPRSRSRRALAGATAVLVPLGLVATTTMTTASPGRTAPLIERAADGPVDEYGGAARLDRDQTEVIRQSIKATGARNVILVIGDGMGDSEITVARNYLKGAGGFFEGLDALPLTGQMTHYSVDKETGRPDYAPDSAATGTAWATGVKTYDNAVSVDRHGKALPTILEAAKRSGRATGNVTTSEIQDATPAVQVSHVALRRCYGPVATTANCPEEAKENGGPGSITEQLLDTRPDVTLGGGLATFAEKATAGRWAGKTLETQAKERGYQLITDKRDLAGVRTASQDKPLLGLFATGNLPVRFAPLVATADGADDAPARCTPEPAFSSVPTLKDMTSKAIDLLASSDRGKRKGFFLQVESASIDKKDHAADVCGQIGETEQIDEAVAAALAFAKKDRNTLVIVTADHAHTSMIVDAPTPGLDEKLLTADGSPMFVTYGTSPAGGSQQHTGGQVRVAAYGPGAANVSGLIDQTDLFFVMKRSLDRW